MASQQPPTRPWFRLARPAPAPTPAPAPAPQPRPTFLRPSFAQTFITPTTQPPPPRAPQQPTPPPPPPPALSPPPAAASPPSATAPPPQAAVAPPSPPPIATTSSVPTSPIIKIATPSPKAKASPTSPAPMPGSPSPALAAAAFTSPATARLPSALPPSPIPATAAAARPPATAAAAFTTARLSSPRIDVKSLAAASPPLKVPSPQIKPLTPPPSPLTLPPAQLQTDVIAPGVLVSEKPKVTPINPNGDLQRPGTALNWKRDVTKDNGNHHKNLSVAERFGTTVITIAGENEGAIMELSPSSYKKGNPGVWRDGKKLVSDSSSSSSNEEERLKKSKDKSHKTMGISSPPLKAFMNSNVQAVNNSILYNCSCTHHDPGVHLSLSSKANGNGR